MKVYIATIVWIFSFIAISKVRSDFSIGSFTVINSTDTSLYARWTVLTNQSISLVLGYLFEFESDPSSNIPQSLTYKIPQSDTVDTRDNIAFEYTFTDINTSLSYSIEVTIATSIARFSSLLSIAPAGAPESILTLVTSSTTLQLYWYLPNTTGIITSYTLNYAGFPLDYTVRTILINVDADASLTGLQGPYNLTGLQEFNSYNITIIASNGLRDGVSEEITILTDQAAPNGPPLKITGESVNSTAIHLSWLPPDELEQNGPITGYNITVIGNQFDSLLFAVPAITYPADTEYNLALVDLAAFTEYNITIRAINSIGQGIESELIQATTLEDVPSGSPVNITAIPIESTKIELTWYPPPADEQNGVIESYYVTIYGHPFDTGVQNRTIYVMYYYYPAEKFVNTTIIGLEEHNNYTIIISAVTEIGEGPSSQEVNVTTGIGAPDLPPQYLAAQSLNSTSILFTWSPPPLLNQNGPIICYNITYRGVIYDTELRVVIIKLDNQTYSNFPEHLTIRRLAPYTNYTISVSAVTIGGNSIFANIRHRTNESVPTTAPDITLLTVLSATELQIHWSHPSISHQNGLITHYTISYTASLFSTLTYEVAFTLNSGYPDIGSYSEIITDLEEFVSYTFTISASTALGTGPDSASETLSTIQAVPGLPALLKVTLEISSVTIKWNPPIEIEQNGPITRYHIIYIETLTSIQNELIYELPTPIIYPANSSLSINATFPVQLLESSYTWYVTAENEAGISAESNNITQAFTLIGQNAVTVYISVVSSLSICCILCIIFLISVHVIVCIILCMRRYREKKIIAVETTTYEMKSRTIFSNRSSLKELEEMEGPKEAIYAVIGKNQFPGASAATDSVMTCVNPIGTPTQEERRDSTAPRLDLPPIDIEAIPKEDTKPMPETVLECPRPMESTPDGSTTKDNTLKESKSIGESMSDDTLKETDPIGDTLQDGAKSMEDSVREESRGSLVDPESSGLEKIEGKERLVSPITEPTDDPMDEESIHLYDNFPDQEKQIT